jgi:hypothetical protein
MCGCVENEQVKVRLRLVWPMYNHNTRSHDIGPTTFSEDPRTFHLPTVVKRVSAC